MTEPTTITRKEIAELTSSSEDTVIRREREWGLDKCRSRATKKPIQYFRQKTIQALRTAGVLL